MALNEVLLQGRLVSDPELRHTPSNVAVCNIRIAVDRDFKDKETGERGADFINVVAWRQEAEFVSRWFTKGSAIIVKGRLSSKSHTDQDGKRRYDMEVVLEKAYFGEKKKDEGSGWTGQQRQEAQFQELQDEGPLPF